MFTFIIFFIILSILILSHELGHFLAAKKTNTKVEEFGFGFPPKIFWKKFGETIYSFNLFPIGGFVRILGEDGISENTSEQNRNFSMKPFWVKSLILSAGVLFNLILAWILISVTLSLGNLKLAEDDEVMPDGKSLVIITQILKGSPAEQAGITSESVITRLLSGNEEVIPAKASDVQNFIQNNKGKDITVFINDLSLSQSEEKSFKVKLNNVDAKDGALGVGLARAAVIKEPFYLALIKGFKETILFTIYTAAAIFYFIAGLFQGTGFENVAGPVGIFKIVGQAKTLGISYITQLAAVLSINLAIINFLPFPALDGGRFLFAVIEKIKGSPLNQKAVNIANAAGFFILIGLMAVITYRDILRIIS